MGKHKATWDAFIVFANEDRDDFVEPLVGKLNSYGLRIWYDRDILQVGDSIFTRINEGISKSRYGIIVLSEAFFSKKWPQRELAAINGLSDYIEILPIWKDLSEEDIKTRLPLVLDRFAIKADLGINQIAKLLTTKIHPSFNEFQDFANSVIRDYFFARDNELNYKFRKIESRFYALADINNLLAEYRYPKHLSVEKQDEHFSAYKAKLFSKYSIPDGVYCEPESTISKEDISSAIIHLESWVRGCLEYEDAIHLHVLIDEILDLDVYYIFFGIGRLPLGEQVYSNLVRNITLIGCRNLH